MQYILIETKDNREAIPMCSVLKISKERQDDGDYIVVKINNGYSRTVVSILEQYFRVEEMSGGELIDWLRDMKRIPSKDEYGILQP